MFIFIIRSIIIGIIVGTGILFIVPLASNIPLLQTLTATSVSIDRDSYYQSIAKAAPAVVNIYSTHNEIYQSQYRTQTFEKTNLGSGVVMDENGFILTCYHVIKDAEQITLGLQDGRFVKARLVGYDAYTDLAVLHTTAQDLSVIPQHQSPNARLGDVVLAIGNPYNLGQTTTKGIISATGRAGWGSYIGNQNYADFIQTDVVLNDGNSGGALIDSNGILLGINNANFKTLDDRQQVKDVSGVSFAVPYTLAKKVMDSIIRHGRVIRGFLGIDVRQPYGNEQLIIMSVSPTSPANAAGLKINDVLVAIDGQRLSSQQTLVQWIAESMPGSVLTLDIIRQGQPLRLPVTLGELKG